MAFGPAGPTHKSQETFVTATPPPAIVDTFHVEPGYTKNARAFQSGPQGNTSSGVAHNWPDTYQRP